MIGSKEIKNKMERLSIGDIIRASNGLDPDPLAVYEIDRSRHFMRCMNGRSGRPVTLSFVEFVKYYDITYDNDGSISVNEVLRQLKNISQINSFQVESVKRNPMLKPKPVWSRESSRPASPNPPKTPKQKSQKLSDVLKVNDIIKSTMVESPARPADLRVLYIDPVSKYVTFFNPSKGIEGLIDFDQIDTGFTRVGVHVERVEHNILKIKETHVEEVYLPAYRETRRDRRYIRYCEKKGRDDVKAYVHKREVMVSFDYDELLSWIKDTLSDQETLKLTYDLANYMSGKYPKFSKKVKDGEIKNEQEGEEIKENEEGKFEEAGAPESKDRSGSE